MTQFEDNVAEEECLNLEGANGYDMCDMARTLIAELKRCYGLIDELLSGSWLHHTVLENEDYMDPHGEMGVFERDE